MILKTLVFKPEELQYLCTVCITDNNGGKIALTNIFPAKRKFLKKNNLNFR